jgi:hypothetical protein
LSNSKERKKYNKKREDYKEQGLMDPLDLWVRVNAEFAANASGTDSGESDSDDSDSGKHKHKEYKPDIFRMNIYKEATPFVHKLLKNPDDDECKSKIQSLNEKISKQNKKDRFEEDQFLIGLKFLRRTGLSARDAVASLKRDPNDRKAKNELKKLEKELDKWVEVNSYPPEWIGEPSSSHKKDKGKAREGESSSSQKKDKGKAREGESSSSQKKDKGKARGDSTGTEISKWKPGETTDRKKILGYRPFEKTNYATGEKSAQGYQFIIEEKGQPNPIALVSGADIGRRAVRAYLKLPESERNDIRYSKERYKDKIDKLDNDELDELIDSFDNILGFASKPFKTKTKGSGAYYPDGYALQSFTDGSTDILNRDCLRYVHGKTDADKQIAEFYKDIGETPPWLIEPEVILKKKPKRLAHGREAKRRGKSRRRDEESQSDSDSDSESESDSDSDSDASGMFVRRRRTKGPARRRGRSDESSDEESDDSSSDRRKPSRKAKGKGKPKPRLAQSDQTGWTKTMQEFMNQMAEQNKRQAENLAKGLEEVLRRRN